MSVDIQPDFDVFETIDATVDVDEWGMATARVSYYAKTALKALALVRDGMVCPLIDEGLLLTARFLHGTAETVEGGVWKVSLFWRGVSNRTREDENAKPSYKPAANTSPIETHPTFESFAGKPTAPLPGALFDANGNFTRFLPYINGEKNPLSGVKNYYQASLTLADSRVAPEGDITTADSLMVGKIDIPALNNLIEIKLKIPGMTEQKRDFLLTTLAVESLGQGWVTFNREWALSGPFGWDKDMYEYADTGDARNA